MNNNQQPTQAIVQEEHTQTSRSIAELRGRTATIREERPLHLRERHNSAVIDEGRRITTIDELNRAFLTPDERAKQEENLDNEKVAKSGTHDASKKRRGDEDKRIFEEGDIIDWMFKNIIIAGMDWGGNKVVNMASFVVGWGLDKTTGLIASVSSRAYKGTKNKLDKWNPYNGGFNKYPEDNTTKFRQTIAGFHDKEIKDCNAYASEDNFLALMNSMQLVSEGRMDEFNHMMNGRISPQTMGMINSLTPEQRQALFSQENAMQATENAIDTAITVKQYSANMAYIRLMTEKMNNKEQPKRDAAVLFAEYQEEARQDMLAYIEEARHSGKTEEQIKEARDELLGLSIAAGQHIDKQIEKRHYNEHDENKPDRNAALDKITVLTAVTKESPYRNQSKMADFASEVINVSTAQQQALYPVQQEEAALTSRWEGNQQRRDNLRNIVNNIQQRRQNTNTNTQQQQQRQQGGRV